MINSTFCKVSNAYRLGTHAQLVLEYRKLTSRIIRARETHLLHVNFENCIQNLDENKIKFLDISSLIQY